MQDISSNFDKSCLCIAQQNKVVIVSINKQKVLFEQEFKKIKIKFASMYMLSNILFIVKENGQSISVYRIDNECKYIDKIKLDQTIQDIKVLAKNIHVLVGTNKTIYVKDKTKEILENSKILVIDIQTFEITQTIFIEYFEDFHFDVPCDNEFYLAYNQPSSGILILRDLEKNADRQINMHKNENYVQIFAFNSTGEYLASLSKGTILKVIQTKQESLSRKFWLNNSKVRFSSITFSYDQQFLAASEDDGKIHLIYWNDNKQEENKQSTRSTFIGFFNKEYAFDQFDKGLKQAKLVFNHKNGNLISYNKQYGIKKYHVCQKTSLNKELVSKKFIELGFPNNQKTFNDIIQMKIGRKICFVFATFMLQFQSFQINSSFQQTQQNKLSSNLNLDQRNQNNGIQKYNWTKEDEMFAFGETKKDNLINKLEKTNRKLNDGNILGSITKQLKKLNNKLNKKTKKLKKKKKHNKKHHKKHHKKHVKKRKIKKHKNRRERMLRQVSDDNKIIVKFEKMTKDEIRKQKRLNKRKKTHQHRILESKELYFKKKIQII